MEDFFRSQGIDPITGRNRRHSSGGAFCAVPISLSTLLFVFYVMMGGNPFFVVLAGSLPIVKHNSSTATSADAALEALFAKGLVRPGTGKPTVIHSINSLFGHPVIHFVQVDEAALASQGHSLLRSKVYSIVDPKTGKTQGGKDASILEFRLAEYSAMMAALLPMLQSSTSPPIARFARGGGSPADSVADHLRLKQVPKMNSNARNSFALLFLINPLGGILLVRTTCDGCWGLPGGKVDPGEKPFKATVREFKEETKSVLPILDGSDFGTRPNEPIKFVWEHKRSLTGIYCGKTSASFSEFKIKFKPTDEICEIGVFTPHQILQMARDLDPINRLRDCAKKSIITILLHLGLIV